METRLPKVSVDTPMPNVEEPRKREAQVEVDHVAERLDEFPELCALWEAHRKDENMPFGVRSGLIGLCMEVTRLVEGTRLVEPLPLDLSEFREVLSGK